MSLLVPNLGEVNALQKWLDQNLTLKLYSNNKTPAEGDTAADYTEVSGAGYASKTLTFANWIIQTVTGTTSAQYNSNQDFNFTGVTSAPGTIYGYYIVDASNTLIFSERFPASVLPFSPVNGSLVRIIPKIEAA